MVIVCGNNMGDIFRRNALNLGLHVVQSPEAVADARDGDEFSFDPRSRRLTNETQGKTYEPVPLTPKEDEIRAAAASSRPAAASSRASVERPPRIEWPDPERARRMTSTEQIVWAHRVDKRRRGQARRDAPRLRRPAAGIGRHRAVCDSHVQPDHRRRDHLPAPGGDRQRSLRLHRHATTTTSRPAIGREFAALHGIEKPYYATPGDGIFHFYFPEQGLVMPGQFIPGADSHSRAYGAYGAVGIGVGSTTLGFGWATGYVYFTLAEGAAGRVRRPAAAVGSGKDIVLELLRRWGARSRRACRWNWSTRTGSCRLPIATRSRT